MLHLMLYCPVGPTSVDQRPNSGDDVQCQGVLRLASQNQWGEYAENPAMTHFDSLVGQTSYQLRAEAFFQLMQAQMENEKSVIGDYH